VLTGEEIYLELVQGDKQPKKLIETVTRDGVEDGSSTIEGEPWERLISSDQRTRSLVRTTPQVTTVVTGDTSYQQLESYVGLLVPVG
jgi:hypothetical protein